MNEAIKSMMRNRIQSEPGNDRPDSPPRRVFMGGVLRVLGTAFGTSILAACGLGKKFDEAVNHPREQVVSEAVEGMALKVVDFEQGNQAGQTKKLFFNIPTARDPASYQPPITKDDLARGLHAQLSPYHWYGKANNGYIEVYGAMITSMQDERTGKKMWMFQVTVRDTRPPPRANGLSA